MGLSRTIYFPGENIDHAEDPASPDEEAAFKRELERIDAASAPDDPIVDETPIAQFVGSTAFHGL